MPDEYRPLTRAADDLQRQLGAWKDLFSPRLRRNTLVGLALAKYEGRRIAGAVPFGYEADPRTKQFFPSSSEAAVVKWMFDQAAAGKTPAEIADAANANGWRTKQRTARRTGTRH